MKISLITPTHNLNHIEELYRSILAQTHEDWEWVLYVNGKAKTKYKYELSKSLREDTRVIIRVDESDNTSVGFLKNSAFKLGTGEILVEMDHDDLIVPECLAKLNAVFESDPEVGFVYSDNAKLDMIGDFVPYTPACGWTYDTINFNGIDLIRMHSFDPDAASMAFIWYMPDHVRAWKREVYHELGGHDVKLAILDDQDLIIRTYLKYKFHYIKEALYIYRITGNNTWLERNEAIQRGTIDMFFRYGYQLAERDAELAGLLKVDIGGGLFPRQGYLTIDQEGAHITCDLNNGIPLPDNSVGVLNASHVLEHLKDPLKSMAEIYRVLADGGWAMIDVPSTDGRGAWMDPTHVSYWNENSFLYYTNQDQAQFIRNSTIRFQEFRCHTYYPTEWYARNQIPVVTAWLRAIKSEKRRPHEINI